MPPDTGSTVPAPLATVVLALETTEQALRDGQAEALPALTETLARALQECQRELQLPNGASQLDAQTRVALVSVGERLATLRELLMRQAGSVNRSLATLFPAEAAEAYGRLGQGPGTGVNPPRVSNHTSLKA